MNKFLRLKLYIFEFLYLFKKEKQDVHIWFELSYAQYLTIPRSVLEAMPLKWQYRFTKLLNELDETIEWRPEHGNQYRCTLHKIDYDYAYWKDEFDEDKYWGDPIYDKYMDYRIPVEMKYLKETKK